MGDPLDEEIYEDGVLKVEAVFSASEPDEKISMCPSPQTIVPLLITSPLSIEFSLLAPVDDLGNVRDWVLRLEIKI